MTSRARVPDPSEERAAYFAAALLAVEQAIDWDALGRAYCWDGGEGFFSDQDRDAIRECGLRFAADLAARLAAPAGGEGHSVYVGAALSELAPILCETLVLQRQVDAFALAGPETESLNAALARAETELGRPLPRIRTGELTDLPPARADHGWLVSVLTDPESFPALHDRLYERSGTELATGRGELATDEARAAQLLDGLLRCLRPDALLHTTDDELPLVIAGCARHGLALDVPERARLSAIVGDPVRCCRLGPAGRQRGQESSR